LDVLTDAFHFLLSREEICTCEQCSLDAVRLVCRRWNLLINNGRVFSAIQRVDHFTIRTIPRFRGVRGEQPKQLEFSPQCRITSDQFQSRMQELEPMAKKLLGLLIYPRVDDLSQTVLFSLSGLIKLRMESNVLNATSASQLLCLLEYAQKFCFDRISFGYTINRELFSALNPTLWCRNLLIDIPRFYLLDDVLCDVDHFVKMSKLVTTQTTMFPKKNVIDFISTKKRICPQGFELTVFHSQNQSADPTAIVSQIAHHFRKYQQNFESVIPNVRLSFRGDRSKEEASLSKQRKISMDPVEYMNFHTGNRFTLSREAQDDPLMSVFLLTFH